VLINVILFLYGDQRRVFFSLKCSRNRLAAGLCPDLLGKLVHSPRPLSRIRGWGPQERMGKEGREEEEVGGEGREGRGREGWEGPPRITCDNSTTAPYPMWLDFRPLFSKILDSVVQTA